MDEIGKRRIGELIRRARNRLEISQLELAKRSGLSRNMINRYELGKALPRLPQLEAVITALTLLPDELQLLSAIFDFSDTQDETQEVWNTLNEETAKLDEQLRADNHKRIDALNHQNNIQAAGYLDGLLDRQGKPANE
jgi:transcriptional regulator with XRE-family HTH domain